MNAATKMRARRAAIRFLHETRGDVAALVERCRDRALVARTPKASTRLNALADWLTEN